MSAYFARKLVLRSIIAVPTPRAVDKALRLWVETKAGENFGDMSINGEFDFLDRHAPRCRVIFDAGASDGMWSARALRSNPAARIHCFEPASEDYVRLTARGFPGNVTCVQTALSDGEGSAPLFVGARSLHGRHGPGFDSPSENRCEQVPLTTLDAYCARTATAEIDLLKIDTEGHDLAVLRGGEAMLRNARIRRIQFEYGPRNVYSRVFLRDFFVFLIPFGFRLYQIQPGRLAPVSYDHRLENLQYKNFAAIHESVEAR